MAIPVVYYDGEATFGMPSDIVSVVSVPSRTGLERRKPGVTTLILYSRGFLALMTHFGA